MIPVILAFDKHNYLRSERPSITVNGMPDTDIRILIVNPSDEVVLQEDISLLADGKTVHEISLDGFVSGVYTAVAQQGTVQTEYQFGVGLSRGASFMKIYTGTELLPGDVVRILGDTSPNSVVTASLTDPGGNTIQTVNTFSDRTGTFSETRIRIPLEADHGIWTVRVASGLVHDTSEILVDRELEGGLSVVVADEGNGPVIMISGAEGVYVTVTILDGDRQIGDSLRAYLTDQGAGQMPWSIDLPGRYTVVVADQDQTIEATYVHS